MIKTVSATDIQNNFGQYLQAVQSGDEIIILKNGKEVARMVSNIAAISFLSDSLVGVLKNDYDEKEIIQESIEKRESIDWYQCYPWRALQSVSKQVIL